MQSVFRSPTRLATSRPDLKMVRRVADLKTLCICLGHPLHELSDICGGSRPTGILAPGKVAPVTFEPPALPVQDGLGSDNHQRRLPLLPDLLQAHPKQSVPLSDLGTANASLKDCQLFAQCEILQSDLFITAQDQEDRPKKNQDGVQHRPEVWRFH